MLREPLGLEYTAEQLAEEYAYIHLAAYDSAWILRGCLFLTPKPDKVLQVRQVAVQAELQGAGIGKALMTASETYARLHGYERLELNARDTAVPFYKKLNYDTLGNMFEEVGIQHFKMVKMVK